MEIEDEVIYEFDLNTSTSKCDLFAFSAKDYPFDLDKQRTELETIRVKPNAKQFEIILNFNESDSLSSKKHDELLIVDEEIKKEDRLMKSKVLKSNYLPETRLKYGICFLSKSKKVLDVVPIERVFDFQCDFSYLENESKSKERSIDSIEQSDETIKSIRSDLLDNQTDAPLSPAPLELQNFTLRYETNYEHNPWSHVNYVNLKERATKEPWKMLKLVNKSKDPKNFGKKKVMFSQDLIGDNSKSTNNLQNCLLPRKLIEEQTNNSDLNSLSLSKIKNLPLSEKINKLLINCIVIPFNKLVSLLASDLDEELIIKILQKSAMLVQGNWVIKSEVLFSNNLNEITVIHHCHDFVSFCFTKSRQLKRQDITTQINFPLDLLMTVLTRLAEYDSKTRTWNFLYPVDEEFILKHESINVQMEITWEIRRLQIFKSILRFGTDREKNTKRKPPVKKVEDDSKVIKKRLRKRKPKT